MQFYIYFSGLHFYNTTNLRLTKLNDVIEDNTVNHWPSINNIVPTWVYEASVPSTRWFVHNDVVKDDSGEFTRPLITEAHTDIHVQ